MIRLAGIHHACDLPSGFPHRLEFVEKWDKLMVIELDQPSTKYAKGDLKFDALNSKVAKELQAEMTANASKAAQQAGGSSFASSAGRKRGAETLAQPVYSLPGPMYAAPPPPQGFQPYLPPPQQQYGFQQGFQPRRDHGKGFRAGGGGGQRPLHSPRLQAATGQADGNSGGRAGSAAQGRPRSPRTAVRLAAAA
jgi:hypothetical protein